MVQLPPNLGGRAEVFANCFSIVNVGVDFVVPVSLQNKNNCVVIGQVWSSNTWNWVGSGYKRFYLRYNQTQRIILHDTHTYPRANTRVNVALRANFGSIANLRMGVYGGTRMLHPVGFRRQWLEYWENDSRHWNCDLKIYFN